MTTWFACQHPEQVRIAQSTAMVHELGSTAAFILSMMALGLAAQVQDGVGWTGFIIWQSIMGALAYLAIASSISLREPRPTPAIMPERRVRSVTVAAALCGACWTVGLTEWTLRAHPQLAVMALAASMVFAFTAVATCYFVPWAVVAFSAPLFAGSVFVAVWTLNTPATQIGVLLIALHGFAAFRLLRKNWTSFTRAIDLDVERNRLAAMLQEQKEIAERAVHLKTRFLASASHDLRQPMHAISLYLDGLAEVDLPERIRVVISDARVCAHDMNDMFRSLLDISRLDAHQAVPALSVFSIGAVLSRVEKEFMPLAISRGIQLKVRPCGDHVYSDPVMVERIALNFVSNAVRYTPGGRRVLVACRVRGRALRLAVYDTGKGIPETDQQTIFDEFRRLDSSRPRDHTGGLGLGLAIVRRLAQALRLTVLVRSTVGRGSMFAVDLPLVHVSRGRPEVSASGPMLVGRLIVVVDDEPSILLAATFILETAGCHVISARSSSEAMLSLTSSTRVPDAIICDHELNDKCYGTDVIRHLREEFNCDIPALLVTGNTAGGRAESSAREMGIPVLYKPLEAAALRSSLENLLTTQER